MDPKKFDELFDMMLEIKTSLQKISAALNTTDTINKLHAKKRKVLKNNISAIEKSFTNKYPSHQNLKNHL